MTDLSRSTAAAPVVAFSQDARLSESHTRCVHPVNERTWAPVNPSGTAKRQPTAATPKNPSRSGAATPVENVETRAAEPNAVPVSGVTEPAVGASPAATTDSRHLTRWWLAVGTGAVVSMPLAWLLSHAALLPFLLGLFFYVLFGLIIGASMHRVASPGRPFSRSAIMVGTTVVVAFGWTTSIFLEGRDAPLKLATNAGDSTHYIGDQTIDEFRAGVSQRIRDVIAERYPPGGSLGYVRWVLASGEIEKGVVAGVHKPLRTVQSRLLWAVRVVLSLALFGFGIGSQTFLLRLERDPAVRAIDEPGYIPPA